jgi:cell division protein FtsL
MPWLLFSMVAVVAFLGMVVSRTSLDNTAIELARAELGLAEARSLNQRLRLEIARLESPARVAPLALQMGMVYPQQSEQLVVSGVVDQTMSDPRWNDMNRFAQSAFAHGALQGALGEEEAP